MQIQPCLAAAACAAGLAVAGSAEAIVIDTFNSGPGLVRSIGDLGPTNYASTDAIGGSRTLAILGFPTDGDATSEGAQLQVAVPPGAIGHSQDAFAPGGRSKVTWDANGAGLGGLDLTDGGKSDAIVMELVFVDDGNVEVTFTVMDSAGATSEMVVDSMAIGQNVLPYTGFTGGAALTDVHSVMMTFDVGQSGDVIIDLLETNLVPEPTAAMLLSTVGLGVIWRRKRGNA